MKRRKQWYLLAACLVVLVLLLANPVNRGFVRAGILALMAAAWVLVVYMLWGRRVLRWLPLGAVVVAVAGLLGPGREFDPAALRACYIDSLKFYEGTWYCWGGENKIGIDCSGLVRRGLFAANLKQSLGTINPGLLRTALSLWWNDASARELKNGYRGRTRPLLDAPSINLLDSTKLSPGDFAITSNGVHALVYIGGGEWMEADPGLMKVVRVKTPVQGNSWFDTPVSIMRWRQLEVQT